MNSGHADMGKGSLLVVDDDLIVRQTLEAFLTREGYQVRCAPSGETALMFANEDPPELVLLDIRIPGADGFQICRRFKESPKTSDIPVIFISGLEEAVDKVEGFAAGGADYITKPFQCEELLARVESHLGLKRAKEEVQRANQKLEERVAERTAELAAAKEQLQEQLQEIELLKQRLERENLYLQEEIKLLVEHTEIVGQSAGIKKILAQAEQVAQTQSTVLLLGETGTGKELLARSIHGMSSRKDRPLMTIKADLSHETGQEDQAATRPQPLHKGHPRTQTPRVPGARGDANPPDIHLSVCLFRRSHPVRKRRQRRLCLLPLSQSEFR